MEPVRFAGGFFVARVPGTGRKARFTHRPACAHYSRAMYRGLSVLSLLLLAPSAAAQGTVRAAHAVSATSDYLARMDADGDGRVSLVEYQDWLSYAFDAMDRDRDGRLASDELPGRKGKAITRAEHRKRLADTFGRQDANRDGHLSAKELAAPPR